MPRPTTPFTPSQAPSASVRIQSLGSGSSGNAFLIERGDSIVMVDCGVGIRCLQAAFRERRRTFADLDAILVTHEHGDHVRNLHRVLGPDTPVVATDGTAEMSHVSREQQLPITADTQPETLAGMTIAALSVSHDAVDPCGFYLEMPEARITILTDLGAWHESLDHVIAASDLVIVEANHDEHMLRTGPYPAYLKRRVASVTGHLSNHACGTALANIARGRLAEPTVWLAHLSNTNNAPAMATRTIRDALNGANVDLDVLALPRRDPGPVWTPPDTRRWIEPDPPPITPAQLELHL